MIPRPFFFLPLLCVLLVLPVSQAAALEDCPPDISPGNPRRAATDNTQKLPLSSSILYNIEALHGLYRIPVGYSWESASVKHADDAPADLKGISFAFWMPSLRYPERNTLSLTSFRPCEDGRPLTSPDQPEYLVRVRIALMSPRAGDALVTPLDMYREKLSYTGGEKGYNFSEVYGLRRFESKKAIDLGHSLYRHIEGTTPEVYMECAEPSSYGVNPACRGYFYFPQAHLSFQMSFASRDLLHWRDMVNGVRELLERWRVADAAPAIIAR